MRMFIALLFLAFALPASAQVVIQPQTDAKISIVFYVKEGTNSPYQGLLQFTPQEYAALTPDQIEAMKLQQFNDWKAATAAAQAANVPLTDDQVIAQKAQQAIDLQNQMDNIAAQIDAIQADPAVAAKITELSGGTVAVPPAPDVTVNP